jgi:hypothetical protein
MSETTNEYLTTAQAAELLRVRPQTLRKRRCTGDSPPFIRFSPCRCLYSRAAILTWLADRSFASTSEEAAAVAAEDYSEGRQ